ncbi:hypothetical protein NUSPORA_00354 [Nucleospora cyclopteri]
MQVKTSNNKMELKECFLICNSSIFKRTILGVLMILLFYKICVSSEIYLIILCAIICIGSLIEFVHLVWDPNSSHATNPFLIFYMVFLLFISTSYSTIIYVSPYLRKFLPICNFRIACFYLYSFGLILYIRSFKKLFLKDQLLLLAVIHLSTHILGTTFKITVKIIRKGKFYMIYPACLIIANDSFAYFVGKLFGKTPLYSLSPKKTVEGFIGGYIGSCIVGFVFVYFKLNYDIFPDPLDTIMKAKTNFAIKWLNAEALYYYNIFFVLFASFVAPFMGFLASALKRLFKKKDYGSWIPGHGGMVDRMDCQIFMVWFTYYFLQGLNQVKLSQAQHMVSYILKNFTNEEISVITSDLSKKINE